MPWALTFASLSPSGAAFGPTWGNLVEPSLARPTAMFYLAAYVLMNVGAFAVVGHISGKGEKKLLIDDLAGLGVRQPMLAPLLILAFLSIVGGLVAIGGRFEHFLIPVFGTEVEATSEAANHATELLLMGLSVLVALSGAVIAWILYVSKPQLPAKIAASLGSFYDAVLHKYYIDELYAKLFVKPLVDGSTTVLWQGIDQKVIDDTVNNTADGARHVSDEVRHMSSNAFARPATSPT